MLIDPIWSNMNMHTESHTHIYHTYIYITNIFEALWIQWVLNTQPYTNENLRCLVIFFFGGGRGSVGRPILQVVQAEQPFLVDFFGSGNHRFGSFFSSPSNGKDMTCSSWNCRLRLEATLGTNASKNHKKPIMAESNYTDFIPPFAFYIFSRPNSFHNVACSGNLACYRQSSDW